MSVSWPGICSIQLRSHVREACVCISAPCACTLFDLPCAVYSTYTAHAHLPSTHHAPRPIATCSVRSAALCHVLWLVVKWEIRTVLVLILGQCVFGAHATCWGFCRYTIHLTLIRASYVCQAVGYMLFLSLPLSMCVCVRVCVGPFCILHFGIKQNKTKTKTKTQNNPQKTTGAGAARLPSCA